MVRFQDSSWARVDVAGGVLVAQELRGDRPAVRLGQINVYAEFHIGIEWYTWIQFQVRVVGLIVQPCCYYQRLPLYHVMWNCACNVIDTVCSMFVGSCVVRVLLPVIFLCGLDGEKPTPGRDRIHYLRFTCGQKSSTWQSAHRLRRRKGDTRSWHTKCASPS